MLILGLNAWHGDSAAVLLDNGTLVAAIEEERLRRVKHWSGFPVQAIQSCLAMAGVSGRDIAHVAIGRDPKAHLWRKGLFAVRHLGLAQRWVTRGRRIAGALDAGAAVAQALGVDAPPPLHYVEHHRAHLASAFLCSPYDEAAVASIDGFGDFTSTTMGTGRGGRITIDQRVFFPHSLGVFYSAVTQYLGFPNYGDEFKVMGLGPFGAPDFVSELRQLVHATPDGGFVLDLRYFTHGDGGEVIGADAAGLPTVARLYSPALERLLGPARRPDEPLTPRHEAIARSLQVVYEEMALHIQRTLQRRTGLTTLCLAGGCAMNSVANGLIREATPFTHVFVPPAASDAGTALGAALSVWHETLGQPRQFVLRHAAWGPAYPEADVAALLQAAGPTEPLDLHMVASDDVLCEEVAASLAAGDVVGWFQGRSEWGARSLGNRSILADPRRADMRDRINVRIKFRERFRPFAPAVLREQMDAWFDGGADDPFMQTVRPIREARRAEVPAITHVDGSGRLQTVSADAQPLFHQLIRAFEEQTGVPMLLNTSFNENEPIVDTPAQAIDCFLRTRMDVLVIGRAMVRRAPREDRG